jgi:pentatricopeptide repeat protein
MAMGAYARAGRFDEAWNLFQSLAADQHKGHDKGETVDDISCQTMITVCADIGQWEKALQVLDIMVAHGMKPTMIHYSGVMKACEVGAQSENTVKVFQRMLSYGLQPNAICYTTVMNALVKLKRCDEAVSYFEQMLDSQQDRDMRPSVFTINVMMSAYKVMGQPRKALDLFKSLQTDPRFNKIKTDVFIFSSLLSVCAGDDTMCDEVVEIFHKMKSDYKISPDIACVNSYIDAHVKMGRYEEALYLFDTMKATYGVKRSTVSYNIAINACEKWGKWERALELLRSMESVDKVKPNVRTYNGVIGACKNGGEHERVLGLVKEMEEKGFTPNKASFDRVLQSFAK